MAKLGNQPSVPSINGTAYKFKTLRHGRVNLSGDSTSVPLNIPTTGVLVHQATDYAHDEIFLWASNHSNASNHTLTVEIGGDGSFTDDNLTFKIVLTKETGLTQIYPGIPHNGNTTVYAKASANNVINIYGYVDRHYRLDLTDKSLGYDGGSGEAIV